MDYGSKYKLQHDDEFSRTNEIFIKERSYLGAETERDGLDVAIRGMMVPDGDDKFEVIKGSAESIGIYSESDYEFMSLFDSDSKKYKIEHDRNSSGYWRGYIMPDLHEEPLDLVPYPVKFTATDGLGTLKNYDFLDAGGNEYTAPMTLLQVIVICLNKIGLELDIYTAVHIYETNMDSGNDDDPLAQAYVNPSRFGTGDNVLDCGEVLKHCLKIFTCEIFQRDGAWNIVQTDIQRSTYRRRKYNYSGVFQLSEDFDPVLEITNHNHTPQSELNCWMDTPVIILQPAYKLMKIIQDYGLKQNLLENPDFTEWNDEGTIPENWTVAGGMDIKRQGDSIRIGNRRPWDDSKNLSQSISAHPAYDAGTDHVIRFKFKYSASTPRLPDTVLFVQLTREVEGALYYWDFDDNYGTGWFMRECRMEIILPAGNSGQELEFFTEAMDDEYDSIITITFFELDSKQPKSYYLLENVELEIQKIIDAVENIIEPFPASLTDEININHNANVIRGDMEVILGDIQQTDYSRTVYSGGLCLDADLSTPTALWERPGISGQKPLLDHVADIIKDEYSNPSQMLSGIVHGHLKLGDVIKYTTTGEKFFKIQRILDYNERDCEMDAEFIELKGASKVEILGTKASKKALKTKSGKSLAFK